jgi:hypothetical protein
VPFYARVSVQDKYAPLTLTLRHAMDEEFEAETFKIGFYGSFRHKEPEQSKCEYSFEGHPN